jgi:hypothetical protein
LLFKELDWKADEERSTAVMIHEFLELEKNYKTLLEATKTEFELPESTIKKAYEYRNKLQYSPEAQFVFENILSDVKNDNWFTYEIVKSVIDLLEKWSFKRAHDNEESKQISSWVLYKIPLDLDYMDLVHNKKSDENPRYNVRKRRIIKTQGRI